MTVAPLYKAELLRSGGKTQDEDVSQNGRRRGERGTMAVTRYGEVC